MTDDQHGEDAPQQGAYGGWERLPQGDYDDGATTFVQFPEGGIDALLSSDSPLAAPGQGYVPPPITLTPPSGAGADPAALGAWTAQAGGTQWPDPNALPQGSEQHAFTYTPGATGQWAFEETYPEDSAPGGAPGHDVTGQWSIPVAGGALPDESGEFTTSSLVEQWGGTPPATLPGGAPAPWATEAVGAAWTAPPHERTEAGEYTPRTAEGPADGYAAEGLTDGYAAEGPADGYTAEGAAGGHAAGAPAGPPAAGAPDAPDTSEAPAEAPGSLSVEALGSLSVEPVEQPYAESPAEAAREASEAAQEPSEQVDATAPEPSGGLDVTSSDLSRAAEAEGEAAPAAPAAPLASAVESMGSMGDTPGAAPVDQAPQDPQAGAPGLPHDDHPLASFVLRVNDAERPVTDAWIGESLLYVLRERLGLAGAKDGCSQGECGACNVRVDGRLVASCLVPAVTAAGSEVRTVEGLAVDGEQSDVQRALARCGAVQCGFCAPGMAMTMHDLLEGNPAPSELETRVALCGNLCRCSGYRGVVEAVREVVAERRAHTGADSSQEAAEDARIPHQGGPGAGGVNPAAFEDPSGYDSPGHPPDRHDHDQEYSQDRGGQA